MPEKMMISSYISPKVEIKKSNIHGFGMFAKKQIQRGEIVFIKGGHILPKEKIFSSGIITSYLPIDDGFYIAAITEEEENSIRLYNNHSCHPNCVIRGEISFIALIDILEGEELTCDYATLDNEEYSFKCNCQTDQCRNVITGYDWKLPYLQKKYKGYFSRYLEDKIEGS